MTCTTSTLKFSAFILNLLCCIFGALMVSSCIYALIKFNVSDSIRIPCIMGAVMGGILFLNTILGCCGAFRGYIRLTWIYAIILFVLMLGQIASIMLLPIDFDSLAKETIDNAWNREFGEKGAMSSYEIKYECCGKHGPDDYADSGLNVSSSCYAHQNSSLKPSYLFPMGCYDVLAEEFRNNTRLEEISDWALVGVEAATILIATLLAINLQNEKRRQKY